MRHGNGIRKLARSPLKRARLLRNLVTHLFLHERLQTTLPRAKSLSQHADKLITLARTRSPTALRRLPNAVPKKAVCEKLLGVLAERYQGRPGGYTRVWRAGPRRSDKAPLAIIELVGNPFDMKVAFAKMAKSARLQQVPHPKPHVPLNRPLLR